MLTKDSRCFIDTLLEIERTGTIKYYEILNSFSKDQQKMSLGSNLDEIPKFVMNAIVESEAIAKKIYKLNIECSQK